MELDKEAIAKLNIPTLTPEMAREIIQAGRIQYVPGSTRSGIGFVTRSIQAAIAAGRLISFGHWDNDTIKSLSKRGGVIFNQKLLGHPFQDPWIFMHHWSDSLLKNVTSVYLVSPSNLDDNNIAEETVLAEMLPVYRNGKATLYIADAISLRCNDKDTLKYSLEMKTNDLGMAQDRAANTVDPFITGLMILNTRNIQQETITPSEKLNRARIKSGKSPIPSYRVVKSEQYITALRNHYTKKGAPKNGTHASPVAHLRRGHWRIFDTGMKIYIKDMIVNGSDEMKETFKRSHYVVKR